MESPNRLLRSARFQVIHEANACAFACVLVDPGRGPPWGDSTKGREEDVHLQVGHVRWQATDIESVLVIIPLGHR